MHLLGADGDPYMTPPPHEIGHVYLRTRLDTLDEPIFITCDTNDTLPDVLRKLAAVYSPIKSKFVLFLK